MDYMHELKEKLCEELEEIARKGDLSAGDLETASKLAATIKDLGKIEMMDDGGYSQDGDWMARGTYDRGNSYRERKRDSMGRYSKDGRIIRGGYRDGHMYSRAEAKEDMMDQIEDMMAGATEKEKEILRRAMDQLEKA